MKITQRVNLFGAAAVAGLVLLAGTMAWAHPIGSFDLFPSGCGSSGASSSGPSGGPSGHPSPSGSGEPCPSGSSSESGPPPTGGSIAGKLTNDAGSAVKFADVAAESTGPGGFHRYVGRTDGTGHYRINGVNPGNYLVSFRLPGTTLDDYAHRKRDRDTADRFAVTAGHTTTVNERALPTGIIKGRFV